MIRGLVYSSERSQVCNLSVLTLPCPVRWSGPHQYGAWFYGWAQEFGAWRKKGGLKFGTILCTWHSKVSSHSNKSILLTKNMSLQSMTIWQQDYYM